MKISARAEYACLALVELARPGPVGEPRHVREIARAQGISDRYLIQVLLRLKAAGLVDSLRGARGGYQLARPAGTISLAEVISAMDGPDDPGRRGGSAASRGLGEALAQARDAEWNVLAAITIESIAARADSDSDDAFLHCIDTASAKRGLDSSRPRE
jgi:Rrf2 family protein